MTRETNNITKDQFSVGTKDDALHTAPKGGMDGVADFPSIDLEGQGTVPRMTPRKKKSNKAFWILQIVGWAGYVPLRLFGSFTLGASLEESFVNSLTAAVIGFCLTLIMRRVYHGLKGKDLPVVITAASLSSIVLGLSFSAIEIIISGRQLDDLIQMFGNATFETTVLFAWSTLYFGFHYYNDLQSQRQKALKATALAQQAQLTMLRYQLNPHFLFNTLNAISTLVLESDGKNANKMITKLSAFLRYTLVNQPTQKVSLEQELKALALYLEIEKVRFETRLNIVYQVSDEAKEALIPSLILQPHIENAVKYAIAPSETGGTLKIIGRIDGRHLVMSVEDDGPGMEDPDKPISKSSSGVGIVNTRDRLDQIYGDKYAFLIQNIQPVGLRVWMKIPFEKENNDSDTLEKEG